MQEWWKKGEDRFESLELPEKVEQQWAQAIEFFKYYDKDMSGDIDREEFKPVYKSLIKAGYNLGGLDQAIATLDESGDGKVSLNEYVSWLVKIGSLPL
jgi:Ca2+-binding EF-hand superfamily protein